MSDKAWIVSTGAYSDYRVMAIFTDKEKAENYRDNYNNSHGKDEDDYRRYRVEEQNLNPDPEDYTKITWVQVKKNGRVVESYGSRNIGVTAIAGELSECHHVGFQEADKWNEEALKIAIEGHDTDKAVRKARKIAEKAQKEDWWGNEDKLRKVIANE